MSNQLYGFGAIIKSNLANVIKIQKQALKIVLNLCWIDSVKVHSLNFRSQVYIYDPKSIYESRVYAKELILVTKYFKQEAINLNTRIFQYQLTHHLKKSPAYNGFLTMPLIG